MALLPPVLYGIIGFLLVLSVYIVLTGGYPFSRSPTDIRTRVQFAGLSLVHLGALLPPRVDSSVATETVAPLLVAAKVVLLIGGVSATFLSSRIARRLNLDGRA